MAWNVATAKTTNETAGPTFIDLFSGAGGLTLGLTLAGWQPLLAIDNWPEAVETHEFNFPGHPVWLADICDVTRNQLEARLPFQPDWVVGGPPCQGFSTVGQRRVEDDRNGLIREFHRVVTVLKPQGFLLENVLGLKDMKFTHAVTVLFEKLGYTVSALVLKAADYGVPQLRRRTIFVGHRSGAYFMGPRKSRADGTYNTVWDAIGDLPPLEAGEAAFDYLDPPFSPLQRKLRRGSVGLQGHVASRHPSSLVRAISFIPDGGNRRSIPSRYQPKSGFHNSYSRLFSKAPAVAITSNMGKPSATRCIHPFQNRGLTAREGARLQTFPDRFHFRGGMISARLQIANAVPPVLAASIARGLASTARWREQPTQLRLGDTPGYPELPSVSRRT